MPETVFVFALCFSEMSWSLKIPKSPRFMCLLRRIPGFLLVIEVFGLPERLMKNNNSVLLYDIFHDISVSYMMSSRQQDIIWHVPHDKLRNKNMFSGQLFIAKPLTTGAESYLLKIEATDGGGQISEQPAIVSISVIRGDSHVPVFMDMPYIFHVREDMLPGIVLGNVQAKGSFLWFFNSFLPLVFRGFRCTGTSKASCYYPVGWKLLARPSSDHFSSYYHRIFRKKNMKSLQHT